MVEYITINIHPILILPKRYFRRPILWWINQLSTIVLNKLRISEMKKFNSRYRWYKNT